MLAPFPGRRPGRSRIPVTQSPHHTPDFENSRGGAGFTVHSPHSHGGSFLQRCVAVVVLVAGTAAFVGLAILPLVNLARV